MPSLTAVSTRMSVMPEPGNASTPFGSPAASTPFGSPAAIARECSLSRAQVEAVAAAAKPDRR